MKFVKIKDLKGTDRQVFCPNGGFISNRILLESDGMGYSLTKTEIPKGEWQYWHYKNHLETCYCIKGKGHLYNNENGDYFEITPDTVYILDKHDDHKFKAEEDTVLICVFNPPLKGAEIHKADGSYA